MDFFIFSTKVCEKRISFFLHLVIFVAPIFQLNTLKDDFVAFVMITLR